MHTEKESDPVQHEPMYKHSGYAPDNGHAFASLDFETDAVQNRRGRTRRIAELDVAEADASLYRKPCLPACLVGFVVKIE